MHYEMESGKFSISHDSWACTQLYPPHGWVHWVQVEDWLGLLGSPKPGVGGYMYRNQEDPKCEMSFEKKKNNPQQ